MPEKFSDIVGSEEDVARIIFSPSYIFEGRVAPTAFRWEVLPSGTVEDYISVLRGDTSNLDSDTRHFKARAKGDTRYGYNVLNVGKIRDIHIVSDQEVNTDVNAFPSQNNPKSLKKADRNLPYPLFLCFYAKHLSYIFSSTPIPSMLRHFFTTLPVF